MADEYVDVVDETDNVVGKELKSVCHEKGLLHRGSAVMIFKDDSKKELLIQRRAACKENKPLKLCVPGGHVMSGESYETAALREYTEEMRQGLPAKQIPFTLLFTFRKDSDSDSEFVSIFEGIDAGPFKGDPEEVDDLFFVPISELQEQIKEHPDDYTQTTVDVLERYFTE